MSASRIILASLASLCQKLSKLVEIWRSSDKNNFVQFSRHGVRTQVHLWPKLCEMPFGFWDMMFTKFSRRTDSRPHSRTDRPVYIMPTAPFFNRNTSTLVYRTVSEILSLVPRTWWPLTLRITCSYITRNGWNRCLKTVSNKTMLISVTHCNIYRLCSLRYTD